jgi:pimeloyl-ACP methyl ester carboxylesterase
MTLEKHRVKVSGGELAYLDEGEGPPAVLLHGFPTSSHLWRDLVPMLAPRFRAIAPDLLGYGDSGKPEDPSALTITRQAGYVRELLETLGLSDPAVIGHDIGGGIAQLMALEGDVRSLVLVDSIAFDSWPIEAVRMLQGAGPEGVDESFARAMVGAALDTGMARAERLAEEDRREYVRPWAADPMAVIRAARAIEGHGLAGTEARLAALDARVLVVWGEDDPFLPVELAERLGEAMPGATVALLPGCSHYVTEDAPEAVLPMIADYLRRVHLGRSHGHDAGPTPVELGISLTRPDRPSDPEA